MIIECRNQDAQIKNQNGDWQTILHDDILIEDKKLKFYDSGHELPNAYIEDVINWIMEHNKK